MTMAGPEGQGFLKKNNMLADGSPIHFPRTLSSGLANRRTNPGNDFVTPYAALAALRARAEFLALHLGDHQLQLLADNHLPETIAPWTIDIETARTLKGGVPPAGLQGVIFKIKRPKNSVVLNLTPSSQRGEIYHFLSVRNVATRYSE